MTSVTTIVKKDVILCFWRTAELTRYYTSDELIVLEMKIGAQNVTDINGEEYYLRRRFICRRRRGGPIEEGAHLTAAQILIYTT